MLLGLQPQDLAHGELDLVVGSGPDCTCDDEGRDRKRLMGRRIDTQLMPDALAMAPWRRRPEQ